MQMGMYVVLKIFLFQKGSSESKEPGRVERVDVIPEKSLLSEDAPAVVKRGGFSLRIYQNSLSIALFLLFFISLVLHAVGGAKEYNEEQVGHRQPQVSVVELYGNGAFLVRVVSKLAEQIFINLSDGFAVCSFTAKRLA